jgi:ABC-type glycerol-3-phosphate transport system substrate-binding protein
MLRRISVIVVLLVAALSFQLVAAQSPIEVEWYVGLGAGGQPAQIEAQEAVVEAFNASHTDVQIKLTIVDNNVAYDTLGTLIAAGNSPDIVGPVGTDGSNAFSNSFLDL